MKIVLSTLAATLCAAGFALFGAPVQADDSRPASAADRTVKPVAARPHRLYDHPAVAVQRLAKQAGYDYASKFYPHPAWLYLKPAPEPDPAVARPAPAGPSDATNPS